MAGGVIGRGVLWSLLVLASGCAAGAGVRGELPAIRSTLTDVYASVARGDEAQYRRLVRLDPSDAYSESLTRTMFESIRLHQAVEQRLGTTRPTTRPGGSLAAVDYRTNARAMTTAVEGWTFTVRGDRATIDQLAGQPGAPTLRRVGGGWMLGPPPWDASRVTATYRLAVENERRLARALVDARGALLDGRAATVEDVNAILRSRLADPATQRSEDR